MNRIDISRFLKDNGDARHVSECARKAIAQLAEAGGGELFFPPGEYLCGSIELLDNITLCLAKGAVLKGAPDIADYYSDSDVNPALLHRYFIFAKSRRNVAICGEGTIDGNGRSFWEDYYIGTDIKEGDLPPQKTRLIYNVLQPKPERTVLMYFASCKDVSVKGVTLRNSPSYTVWTVDCEDVIIDGLTIRNPRNGPNTDALDIDCTERVRIHNCDREAGDDCIAIKSDPNRIGRFRPCQDVVASGCRLSTSTCAIRLGYEGDAPIRNMTFRDMEFVKCRIGFDILAITPVCRLKIEHGSPIDDILFEDITMRDVGQAFYIWCGCQPPLEGFGGHIRNVTFRRVDIESVGTSYIGGNHPEAISGLRFEDVKMVVSDESCIPDTENPDTTVPSHWSGHLKCGGLRFNGTMPALLSNVNVKCLQPGWPDIIITGNEKEISDEQI